MLILSRVCVEFRTHTGLPLFRVNPADRMTLLDAPEAIREDPIFSLLVADGSLEVVESRTRTKELELDPVQDADATGKRKPGRTAKADAADADDAETGGSKTASGSKSAQAADVPAEAASGNAAKSAK